MDVLRHAISVGVSDHKPNNVQARSRRPKGERVVSEGDKMTAAVRIGNRARNRMTGATGSRSFAHVRFITKQPAPYKHRNSIQIISNLLFDFYYSEKKTEENIMYLNLNQY